MGNVTRAEFYTALAGVWVYVVLLTTRMLEFEERRWAVLVLWAGALLTFVDYAVKARRARRSGGPT